MNFVYEVIYQVMNKLLYATTNNALKGNIKKTYLYVSLELIATKTRLQCILLILKFS